MMAGVENFILRNIVSCFKLLEYINLCPGWRDECWRDHSVGDTRALQTGKLSSQRPQEREVTIARVWRGQTGRYQQLTASQPSQWGWTSGSMRDLVSENKVESNRGKHPTLIPASIHDCIEKQICAQKKKKRLSVVSVYKIFIKRNSLSLPGSNP